HSFPTRRSSDLGRYHRFWPETVLVLLSPFGDRFFAQYVKNLELEGNSYDKTWFEYTNFSSISSVFPLTTGSLEPFHVGIYKLAGIWKQHRDSSIGLPFLPPVYSFTITRGDYSNGDCFNFFPDHGLP